MSSLTNSESSLNKLLYLQFGERQKFQNLRMAPTRHHGLESNLLPAQTIVVSWVLLKASQVCQYLNIRALPYWGPISCTGCSIYISLPIRSSSEEGDHLRPLNLPFLVFPVSLVSCLIMYLLLSSIIICNIYKHLYIYY